MSKLQEFQYRIRPEIAQVLSNKVRIPYFSFGEYLDNNSSSIDPQISLDFQVTKDLSKPEHLNQKFHFCVGQDNSDEIYYERPLGLGIVAKMHCKNLHSNPQVIVNNSYYKFIRSRIDNAFPPGVHLADLLCLKLLEKDYSPLHCAAISSEDKGFLLAAPPDTGKSITTLLAAKRGYGFLSEDIAFIDDKNVYSNPATATFYHTENFKSSKSIPAAIFNFMYLKVPMVSYFMDPPNARIYDIMKDIRIEEKLPVETIFILDRGSEEVREVDAEEATRRLLIINRNEFSYHKNTLLFAYSYFNRQVQLKELMEKEENIISHMTSRVKAYLIRSNNPRQYIELIDKALK
jgi:hypothetical protein